MASVFEQLAGQDSLIAELRAASSASRSSDGPSHRMTHAWLFTGPPGSGRSIAALSFAAALNCLDPTEPGCGECKGCTTTLAKTHPDVHILQPQGVMILLKDVEAALRRATTAPSVGAWQIVIIEDADRLNEHSGNALLKAVEEPPARTVFMLCSPTSDPADIMVTLRSRSRHIYVSTPSVESVARVLQLNDGVDAQTAQWAASVSNGHVGRARWLATDETTRNRRELSLSIPMNVHDVTAVYPLADKIVTSIDADIKAVYADIETAETTELRSTMGGDVKGRGAGKIGRGISTAVKDLEKTQKARRTRAARDLLDLGLVDIIGFYRDALSIAMGARVDLIHPDKQEHTARVGNYYTPACLMQVIDAVTTCREGIDRNMKPRFAFAAMIGDINTIVQRADSAVS